MKFFVYQEPLKLSSARSLLLRAFRQPRVQSLKTSIYQEFTPLRLLICQNPLGLLFAKSSPLKFLIFQDPFGLLTIGSLVL